MVVIDADSLVHAKTALASREDTFDSKKVAYEVYKTAKNIAEEASGNKDEELLIILSGGSSFRDELTPDYKNGRPQKRRVEKVKEALTITLDDEVLWLRGEEADDYCVLLSKDPDIVVASLDKDVLNAAYKAYDYKHRDFYENDEEDIELWYVKQALMGDAVDGIPGAEGIGAARVEDLIFEGMTFEDFAEYFYNEEDAILSMRLVRMDQLDINDIVTLWEPKDWRL